MILTKLIMYLQLFYIYPGWYPDSDLHILSHNDGLPFILYLHTASIMMQEICLKYLILQQAL